MIGLLMSLSSYNLAFILCKARLNNFYWLSLSINSFFKYFWSLITPYFWSSCRFFAIIDRALPFLGSLNTKFKEGEIPKILLLMNFLSFMKLPFYPSMSDSKKINLPFMLPWSKSFSMKNNILSKASSLAFDLMLS